MLIPTGYKQLPFEDGCYNNQVVFGSTTSQMASALAQLSNCKFLGQAHYHIGKSTLLNIGGARRPSLLAIKGNFEYNLLYQSTPLSSHLAIMVQYRAYGNPDLSSYFDVQLRDTASNSYTGTILDHGVRFNKGVELTGVGSEINTAFTGTELINAPTNTAVEAPRPLYVPSANRGELLNITFDFVTVQAFTVHIYDLLIPEVTP